MNKKKLLDQQQVKGQSFTGTANIILNYLINDIKKKPRSFKIGIFSIFLVIGFLSAIESAFQLSPVIFLTIAEGQVGDADMIMTPLSFQNSSFAQSPDFKPSTLKTEEKGQDSLFSDIHLLNSTSLENTCEEIDGIQGCSPRWVLLGNLYNKHNTMPIKMKFRSYVITVDSVQERNVGLGRRFKADVLQEGQAYVTATAMRGLGLEEGDDITLNIDLIEAMIKNKSILNLNLSDDTDDAVKKLLSQEIRNILLQQFPWFVDKDGKEIGLSKKQIIELTETMQKLSYATENSETRDLFYEGVQEYFDNENINLDARKTMDPVLRSDNFTRAVNDLNKAAYKLPNSFLLNSTLIANDLAPIIMKSLNITEDFNVIKSVDSPKGKWASALGNTIVLDSKFIIQKLWRSLSNSIESRLDSIVLSNENPTVDLINAYYKSINISNIIYNQLGRFDLNDYSISQNSVFNDRMEIYTNDKSIKKNIVKISNAFSREVGKSAPIQSSAPLATTVGGLLVLKMFLDNMIATSIFLLFALAVLLIYSLMISDVEEKTYEFGMLRALGFKKPSLIYLIIVEGLFFAIPGLALGLLMAYLISSFIAYVIFEQSMVVTSYELHWSAIILAFGLGIFIPLFSVYLPIRRAMSKTLRDSLDLYHRVVNEISISVQKLEKLGISFSQFLNAITLIVMGVMCYYFAPAAFVYQDMALFLAIINVVLILMLIGFTLLLNLTQPLVERLYVKLFLLILRSQKHLEPIIIKNMAGHRRRNGKTALMYTVALSFLIFAGTGFNLQSKSIVDNLKSQLGSDLKVMLLNDNSGLDEYGMRQFLELYMKIHPDHIQSYSFTTLDIEAFPLISKPQFSSLSQFPTNKNLNLYGVESNYLSSAYLDYYYPTDFDPKISFPKVEGGSNNIDAVYGLFSDEGLDKLGNSVDYFQISSNSNVRDQSMMGGGTQKKDEDDDSDSSNEDAKPTSNQITSISRKKYEDKEIKLIVPSGLHYISSIDVNTPCLLDFADIKYRARIRATAKKFPGFKFSSYRQIFYSGDLITSTEQFKYLLDSYYYYQGFLEEPKVLDFFSAVQPNSTFGLPKSYLNVQFQKSLDRSDREAIGNGLRNYFKSDFTQLFDVPSTVEQVEETLYFINLFSIVIALISIILSFFLILVSFVANIKENSWEFGVLRAIGLSKNQITGVYMIESCSLVLASGTIGTVIGIIIAVTLTLQLLMFTELPFVFVFPYTMFFITFFFGVFIAAAASYAALSEFKHKPISTIVKGLL